MNPEQRAHNVERSRFWARCFINYANDTSANDAGFTIEELCDSALKEFDKRFPMPTCAHVYTPNGTRCTKCGNEADPIAYARELEALRELLAGAGDTVQGNIG